MISSSSKRQLLTISVWGMMQGLNSRVDSQYIVIGRGKHKSGAPMSRGPRDNKPTTEFPRKVSDAGLFAFKEMYERIKFLKKQQWTTTNYVALIYGAIFGVIHLSDEPLTQTQIISLGWFAVIACTVGLFHLFVVERHMQELREETNRALKFIFGEYKGKEDTERGQIIGDDTKHGLRRDLPFLFAFVLVIVGGAVLVLLFI